MDMKGFTPWKFNAETRAFLQATIKVASDNYPESIYKTYLVNTPFVFRGVWSVISKWIDENTVRKFSLGGEKDYMPSCSSCSTRRTSLRSSAAATRRATLSRRAARGRTPCRAGQAQG